MPDYPLLCVEDCIDGVGPAKFVTKLDLLKGYWQIPLTLRVQNISTFVTPFSLFSYMVFGFGLRNAPTTFQRLMNHVVAGLDGCAFYLDDLVIFSDTRESHLQRLGAILDCLIDMQLTVNLAKCELARGTVTHLRKVVRNGGEVRPIQVKVDVVLQYPAPTTKKDLW